jgi:endonuclease YncB( thermonuclease family)
MIGAVRGRGRAAAATAVAAVGLWAAVAAPALGGVVAPVADARAPAAAGQAATVRRVVDGDTIDVRIGGANRRVRLLQVDTPEVYGGAECYGAQASAAMKRLLPVGTAVTLYDDPALDRTDAYGRLLRYAFRGTTNVNVSLVANGYAAPYFYRGERGRYAAGLERVARAAIAARKGLWGACPRATYAPDRALDSGPA